jgi:phage terminase large subunit-like protein
VNNVSIETDAAGNIKPSKKKSRYRIDGVVASIIALERMMRNTGIGYVYAERGMRSL